MNEEVCADALAAYLSERNYIDNIDAIMTKVEASFGPNMLDRDNLLKLKKYMTTYPNRRIDPSIIDAIFDDQAVYAYYGVTSLSQHSPSNHSVDSVEDEEFGGQSLEADPVYDPDDNYEGEEQGEEEEEDENDNGSRVDEGGAPEQYNRGSLGSQDKSFVTGGGETDEDNNNDYVDDFEEDEEAEVEVEDGDYDDQYYTSAAVAESEEEEEEEEEQEDRYSRQRPPVVNISNPPYRNTNINNSKNSNHYNNNISNNSNFNSNRESPSGVKPPPAQVVNQRPKTSSDYSPPSRDMNYRPSTVPANMEINRGSQDEPPRFKKAVDPDLSPNVNNFNRIDYISRHNSDSSFRDSSTTTNSSQGLTRHAKMPKWVVERKFHIGSQIGKGQFGEVFQCMNNRGQLFAVKKFVISSQLDLKALCDEHDLLLGLKHVNIVSYVGFLVDEEKQFLYIFQDWIAGGSLADLLKKYGPLQEPAVKSYTQQLLCGLAYLHKNNVVHRDIKGANILIEKDGTIKLADFGASQEFDGEGTSETTTIRGTPYFMAPEVLKLCKYGRKGDIWAVGCTIIQMLTAEVPWKKYNMKTLVQLHMHLEAWPGGPPPLNDDENNPKIIISNELEQILFDCFQKDYNKRPHASELLSRDYFMQMDDLEDSMVEVDHEQNGFRDQLERAVSKSTAIDSSIISYYDNKLKDKYESRQSKPSVSKPEPSNSSHNSPYMNGVNSRNGSQTDDVETPTVVTNGIGAIKTRTKTNSSNIVYGGPVMKKEEASPANIPLPKPSVSSNNPFSKKNVRSSRSSAIDENMSPPVDGSDDEAETPIRQHRSSRQDSQYPPAPPSSHSSHSSYSQPTSGANKYYRQRPQDSHSHSISHHSQQHQQHHNYNSDDNEINIIRNEIANMSVNKPTSNSSQRGGSSYRS